MKHRATILIALAALPLTAALAQTASEQQDRYGQIIRARQAGYGLSAATFAQMKTIIDNNGDVTSLTFGARQLQRWARTLPNLFPEGSNLAPSNARDEVWTNRAGFEARAAAYAGAAGRLADAAQAGDRAAVEREWAAVRGACSDCHDSFRATAGQD